MTNVLQLARDFIGAIEHADEAAVRGYYADDATIWHNFDNKYQTVDDNIASLHWMAGIMTERRYEIVRLDETSNGFLDEHVLHGVVKDTEIAMPAAVICVVDNGKITELREYLDPAVLTKLLR